MKAYSGIPVILALFFGFSCTRAALMNDIVPADIHFDLPPKRELPELRILNHKSRDEGAALALWLGEYLEDGIAGAESLADYSGSYLFIASIRSTRLEVLDQWMQNYSLERDFSRLVAGRIQNRLDRDLSSPPDMVYGPHYERAVKAAYGNVFWGSRRLDDSWILGIHTITDEDAGPAGPMYWGFILVKEPRETLEIQITKLLAAIPASGNEQNLPAGRRRRAGTHQWTATREQNAAYNRVKEHFFEQF
jgi:hypothetical protein